MRDEWFAEYAGNADCVPKAVISQDRKKLLSACAPVATYVSKLIAHRTPIQELRLTIPEVDTALDAIEVMFQRYMRLLTGRDIVQLEPAVQFDWQGIFAYAWAPLLLEDETI